MYSHCSECGLTCCTVVPLAVAVELVPADQQPHPLAPADPAEQTDMWYAKKFIVRLLPQKLILINVYQHNVLFRLEQTTQNKLLNEFCNLKLFGGDFFSTTEHITLGVSITS